MNTYYKINNTEDFIENFSSKILFSIQSDLLNDLKNSSNEKVEEKRKTFNTEVIKIYKIEILDELILSSKK
jgi:hypothetical protein